MTTTTFPERGFEAWRRRVEEELGAESVERTLVRDNAEGLRVEPLYTADHPGEGSAPLPAWPHRRGWRSWQRYRHPDLARVGRAVARDAGRGLEGAWLVLDPAARRGWRPDGDEARSGVPLGDAVALAEAFSRLPAGRVALGLEGGRAGAAAGAVLIAASGRRGILRDRLGAVLGLDPLGDAAADGGDPSAPLSAALAVTRWTVREAPGVLPLVARSAPYHEAGADAVLETALVVAAAAEMLRLLIAGGIPPAEAASRLGLAVTLGRDVYVQIAKVRAVRWLWSGILGRAGAAGTPFRLFGETARRTKTLYDPWNNALRETLEGMAGVVGGCTDLTIRPWSALRSASGEAARRLAIQTGTILREESRLGAVADPARGSFYVEHLTATVARAAWDRVREVEAAGGFRAALASGAVAGWVEAAADRRRALVEARALPVTGVTEFPNRTESFAELPEEPAETAPPDRRPDAALGERLRELAGGASSDAGGGAVFEAAVAAAAAGATVREIADAWGLVASGDVHPPLWEWRDADPFEELRRAVDRARAAGRDLAVALDAGPGREASWVRAALAVAGIGTTDAATALPTGEGSVALIVPREGGTRLAERAAELRERGVETVLAYGDGRNAASGIDAWLAPGEDQRGALELVLARMEVPR